MSDKLSEIERLAREICWAEFSPEGRKQSGSKIEYWARVSPLKKAAYKRDARFLTCIVTRLPRRVIAQMVCPVLSDKP